MFVLRHRLTLLLLFLVFFVSGVAVGSPREDAIKSGFIYNFARYSQGDWFNAKQKKRYNICSFDPQFIDIASYTLKDRTIENVPVTVHLLKAEFDSISDCNTLFISENDGDRWLALNANKALSQSKLMLVGESDGFIASGGHINFFIVGGKVRFEVDPIKLQQAGINMSSKVLRLGRIYKGMF